MLYIVDSKAGPDLATNQKVARSSRAGRTNQINKLREPQRFPFPFAPTFNRRSVFCRVLPHSQVWHFLLCLPQSVADICGEEALLFNASDTDDARGGRGAAYS